MKLTVIIRTLADEKRSGQLYSAIESALDQGNVVGVIAVVNGNRYEREVLEKLERTDRLTVVMQDEADIILALCNGIAKVETDYFCFLDDDDLLLSGACERRVSYLDDHPHIDVLVTRGRKRFIDGRVENAPEAFVENDPVFSLLNDPWMSSCSAVFRTKNVPHQLWSSAPKYQEWTYYGAWIANNLNVSYDLHDAPAQFQIQENAGSVSASVEYGVSVAENTKLLLPFVKSKKAKSVLKKKISSAHHSAALVQLLSGSYLGAWKSHLSSLCGQGGWRYLLFTRYLIIPGLLNRRIND